jgi:hypothetical protein
MFLAIARLIGSPIHLKALDDEDVGVEIPILWAAFLRNTNPSRFAWKVKKTVAKMNGIARMVFFIHSAF